MRGSIVKGVRRRAPKIVMATVVEEGLSGEPDDAVLEFAWQNNWLVVSHDVNTMKAEAEQRIRDGTGTRGLFLAPQSRPNKPIVDSLILIWEASEFEEWKDRIIYLPI